MATSSRPTGSSGTGAKRRASGPTRAASDDTPSASESTASPSGTAARAKPEPTNAKVAKKPAKAAPAKKAEPEKTRREHAKVVKATGKARAASSDARPTAVAASEKRRRKLVRDSFTMPREDFDIVVALKERAQALGRPTRNSEVLRAGVHALGALDDAQFRTALDRLVVLKKGRPKKGR